MSDADWSSAAAEAATDPTRTRVSRRGVWWLVALLVAALLGVGTVFGGLAWIGVAVSEEMLERSGDTLEIEADLEELHLAIAHWARVHDGAWPAELDALREVAPDARPYMPIDQRYTDPWRRPYAYEVDGARYELSCADRDGTGEPLFGRAVVTLTPTQAGHAGYVWDRRATLAELEEELQPIRERVSVTTVLCALPAGTTDEVRALVVDAARAAGYDEVDFEELRE